MMTDKVVLGALASVLAGLAVMSAIRRETISATILAVLTVCAALMAIEAICRSVK